MFEIVLAIIIILLFIGLIKLVKYLQRKVQELAHAQDAETLSILQDCLHEVEDRRAKYQESAKDRIERMSGDITNLLD